MFTTYACPSYLILFYALILIRRKHFFYMYELVSEINFITYKWIYRCLDQIMRFWKVFHIIIEKSARASRFPFLVHGNLFSLFASLRRCRGERDIIREFYAYIKLPAWKVFAVLWLSYCVFNLAFDEVIKSIRSMYYVRCNLCVIRVLTWTWFCCVLLISSQVFIGY